MPNNLKDKITIAVDGPAASGKGTIALALSKQYNLIYMDTGLLYRAVASKIIDNEVDIKNERECYKSVKNMRLESLNYNEKSLRNEKTGFIASKIASIEKLRNELLKYQKMLVDNIPENYNGIILDGRDIGTKVIPNANLKLFITASVEIRALRRNNQLNETNKRSTYAKVLKELRCSNVKVLKL